MGSERYIKGGYAGHNPSLLKNYFYSDQEILFEKIEDPERIMQYV